MITLLAKLFFAFIYLLFWFYLFCLGLALYPWLTCSSQFSCLSFPSSAVIITMPPPWLQTSSWDTGSWKQTWWWASRTPATWETDAGGATVQGQPRQQHHKTQAQKIQIENFKAWLIGRSMITTNQILGHTLVTLLTSVTAKQLLQGPPA